MKYQKSTHSCSGDKAPRKNGYIFICEKPGMVERDGKWYCRLHDPLREKPMTPTQMRQKIESFDTELQDLLNCLDGGGDIKTDIENLRVRLSRNP